MKRTAQPKVSSAGEEAVQRFQKVLTEHEDLSAPTIRNYLSDLRQFIAWWETMTNAGREELVSFHPSAVATPALTQYREELQHHLQLQPATVNRHLISLKRYFSWASENEWVPRNPAKVVKLIPQKSTPPRWITDQEEQALVAAVTIHGSLRDRTILTLLLHTGLRARELCSLTPEAVTVGKRSGLIRVTGKRRKYREIPLNATARESLKEYLRIVPRDTPVLFPSAKTGRAMTERALGYLVRKYAGFANVHDVSPHDLRHRFGYRMAAKVPIHRLAQIMGHDSLDTTMIYVEATRSDLQQDVETIAWT